jgi:Ca2+-binding EF-hand superfamily protein
VEKQDKAEMAFKLYDKDKDGYITKAEMTKLSKTLTKDQIDKVPPTTTKIPFIYSQKRN